jgi:hypothetical protein
MFLSIGCCSDSTISKVSIVLLNELVTVAASDDFSHVIRSNVVRPVRKFFVCTHTMILKYDLSHIPYGYDEQRAHGEDVPEGEVLCNQELIRREWHQLPEPMRLGARVV